MGCKRGDGGLKPFTNRFGVARLKPFANGLARAVSRIVVYCGRDPTPPSPPAFQTVCKRALAGQAKVTFTHGDGNIPSLRGPFSRAVSNGLQTSVRVRFLGPLIPNRDKRGPGKPFANRLRVRRLKPFGLYPT